MSTTALPTTTVPTAPTVRRRAERLTASVPAGFGPKTAFGSGAGG